MLAQGLPCFGGARLAVDVTLRSLLPKDCLPRPRADREDGAALTDARLDKEDTYPELLAARGCRLVVVAVDTGGRWSDEAVQFFRMMAPAAFRKSATLARQRRWTCLLAVSCARAFAQSLVEPAGEVRTSASDGDAPPLSELLCRA